VIQWSVGVIGGGGSPVQVEKRPKSKMAKQEEEKKRSEKFTRGRNEKKIEMKRKSAKNKISQSDQVTQFFHITRGGSSGFLWVGKFSHTHTHARMFWIVFLNDESSGHDDDDDPEMPVVMASQ
jgi:hypothetical protein